MKRPGKPKRRRDTGQQAPPGTQIFSRRSPNSIVTNGNSYHDGLFELSADNASGYLASRDLGDSWRITPLGGGVSNTVLLAESAECRLVLKQSLARLRVEQEWLSDRSRIARECAAIRMVRPHFPVNGVPQILFEDADNFLYAMTPAPDGARDWKTLLLAGQIQEEIADRIGSMLAAVIKASWSRSEWQNIFGDQTVFDQLRLDPYYRATARRHPDLSAFFDRIIESCRRRRVSFVHGDWSPKNFLVAGDAVMAIDFEVAHFGNPAFDAAFMLNHLALKAFYRPELAQRLAAAANRFWSALQHELPDGTEWLESETLAHTGGLMLARIDGKSPAEYIRDASMKDTIRRFARSLICDPPPTVRRMLERLPL